MESSQPSEELHPHDPSSSPSSSTHALQKRRKDLFGDCALVEIIHLHDCLRGALRALERDVTELSRTVNTSSSSSASVLLPNSSSELLVESSSSSGASLGRVPLDPGGGRNDSDAERHGWPQTDAQDRITELERRVAGRFKVIWSVFRAHSAAEDEFIWPALRDKQAVGQMSQGTKRDDGHIKCNGDEGLQAHGLAPAPDGNGGLDAPAFIHGGGRDEPVDGRQEKNTSVPNDNGVNPRELAQPQNLNQPPTAAAPKVIEQEEYEEDHADEERMFRTMDGLLSDLRAGLSDQRRRSSSLENTPAAFGADAISPSEEQPPQSLVAVSPAVSEKEGSGKVGRRNSSVNEMATTLSSLTTHLSTHLMAHLEKEETQCMPLVVQHLTKSEIHDLVGQIMGKRSSDLMSQILTMAVQNLNENDREEMVRYMKQAMGGTFFERWLSMGGWTDGGKETAKADSKETKAEASSSPSSALLPSKSTLHDQCPLADSNAPSSVPKSTGSQTDQKICPMAKHPPPPTCAMCASAGRCLGLSSKTSAVTCPTLLATAPCPAPIPAPTITSPEELETLIRAIASNPELTPVQKNTTIQGLRDSVWKGAGRNNKRKRADETPAGGGDESQLAGLVAVHRGLVGSGTNSAPASAATATRLPRMTPPSMYYKKGRDGKVELVWSSDTPSAKFPSDDKAVPLFSASELAPTYHDGATAAVLGCPHYARSCKLRHPSSGRLYTCRLCCEQEREMPMKDQDSPLDRYAVTEVLCMRCGALQPSDDRCVNPKCESRGKPYAKYNCDICNFYDDGPNKSIYHCPFCNVCRSGAGLGIDYRHCMRCNACVSLAESDHHCIPQRLQGNCPICHETMFESTEPLRGLKCGHVMHLSCFGMYMRGHSYTCPLCKKSVEDMGEYFKLLDAAVRMQPMPVAYSDTVSNIYCQDCGKIGKVQYHFVGCKCSNCGSYNTRELGRVERDETG